MEEKNIYKEKIVKWIFYLNIITTFNSKIIIFFLTKNHKLLWTSWLQKNDKSPTIQ